MVVFSVLEDAIEAPIDACGFGAGGKALIVTVKGVRE